MAIESNMPITLRPKINIFNCQDEQREGNSAYMLADYDYSSPGCSQIEDYTFGQVIGKGAYAEVKECIHRRTGNKVAIKAYDRYKLIDIQRRRQAMREIKLMSKAEHPNIVKLIESIDTLKYVYLVMEYAHGESLHSHLKNVPNKQFTEDKAKVIIKQLLEAIEYLHLNKIAH